MENNMRGFINKGQILESYHQKSHLDKFEAITEVINETLPEDTAEMPYSEYYHTIYTVWNIIEQNET
jgi:predicted RNA-binding protein with PUA-like domain